jgi:hypothetical protein
VTTRPTGHYFAARRRSFGVAARRRGGLLIIAVLAIAGCSACSGSSGANTSAPSNADIAGLLTRHGKAVLEHDHAAFVADLDGDRRATTFRAAQDAAFANLVQVPLSKWSYTIGRPVDDKSAQAAAQREYGGSALIMQVSLTYALRGVDRIPTRHDLWWTFVRRNGHVVVAADSDLADAGGVSWKGPWDFGPLELVRGRSSLVLGHPDSSGLLHAVADTIDAAVPVVTSVWGSGWSGDVAAIVPSTPAELTAALGPTSSDPAPIAAVAQSDGQDPVSGKVYGQRLVVVPDQVKRLSVVGRRIVIQHEVTHIAAAEATTDAVPRWLVEGFADYVGNLHSGQTVRTAAAELRADVQRNRVPTGLPGDAQFDTTSTAAQAYESSWLACRLIAQRVGQAGLVRFYRLVGASPDASDLAVAAALRSVLHETPAQFLRQWRSFLRAQLG